MRQQFKQLVFSKLVRASTWLFTGGFTAGVLGYFFQILMGRMLSVSEYGILSALLAMMMVVGAPMATLSMIVARRVSTFLYENDKSKLSYLFYWINRKLFFLAVAIIIFFILNTKTLQNFLSINDSTHLYLLLIILLISFPLAIFNAFFQGLRFFKWLSFSGILTSVFKIIFAPILVFLGWGVSGALGGIVLSTLIVLFLNYVILHPSLSEKKLNDPVITEFLFKSSLPVLLANVAFAFMSQIDMILVKYYFTEHDAGIYASASILGKAVMYFPGGVAMALFPMVATNHAGGISSKNLMVQAVSITLFLSVIGALFYYFFAESIILMLLGNDFIEAANILRYYGFAIAPMALIMIAEYFLIAMGKVLFAYLFIVVAPLQFIAIYYYHDTLMNVVTVLFVSGITLVMLGYGLLWGEFKK